MLRSLQACRGIAALTVVAYHLSISFGDARYVGHGILTWLTWRMNLGVDFFFVLSGFIIVMVHGRDVGRPERFTLYLRKRFARVYPAYWVYAGAFVALVALGFGNGAGRPHGVPEWVTTFSLIRFVNMFTPISPAWTLFHEIAFYAVFSLMILRRRLGIAAFVAWQAICLMLMHYPFPSERTPFATYFAAYNLDFSIGMGAYLLSRTQAASNVAWLAAGLLIFSVTYACEASGLAFAAYPFFYALSFGLVLAFIVNREAAGRLPRLALLEAIGDASYSIYLVHESAIGLVLKLVSRLTPPHLRDDLVLYVVVFAWTVLLGYLAYVFVEKPVLALARGSLRAGPAWRPRLPGTGLRRPAEASAGEREAG